MAMEIVNFPIENGDLPTSLVCLPNGNCYDLHGSKNSVVFPYKLAKNSSRKIPTTKRAARHVSRTFFAHWLGTIKIWMMPFPIYGKMKFMFQSSPTRNQRNITSFGAVRRFSQRTAQSLPGFRKQRNNATRHVFRLQCESSGSQFQINFQGLTLVDYITPYWSLKCDSMGPACWFLPWKAWFFQERNWFR